MRIGSEGPPNPPFVVTARAAGQGRRSETEEAELQNLTNFVWDGTSGRLRQELEAAKIRCATHRLARAYFAMFSALEDLPDCYFWATLCQSAENGGALRMSDFAQPLDSFFA